MKNLIVTADDFGASSEVNEAVIQAHRRGILQSASLMVGAPAAADAVRRAKETPTLGVGLHLVLVDGRPALSPREVSALVDKDGYFSKNLVRAGFNFFFNPQARRQLKAEIRAQFDAFSATGLALDHVNAHNHMHVHPTVLDTLLQVGKEHGVRAVRLPREPFLASWRASGDRGFGRWWNAASLSPWIALMEARLGRERLVHNHAIFGINDTGAMIKRRVQSFLSRLPDGLTEMYFHPAVKKWSGMTAGYQCEAEYATLIDPDVAQAVRAADIHLTTFAAAAQKHSL